MSEWMGIHDEELEELDSQNDPEGGFEVTDIEKADWCLEKIREHRREIEKWTSYHEAEKNRVCMRHENAIFKLESMLRGFFFQQDEAGLTRKTKTMTICNLPTGRIFIKHQQPEFERDDEKILEWLRVNAPHLVKVTETVDWAGMKSAYTFDSNGEMVSIDEETGEIIKIPGVIAKARDDVFKAEPNKKEDK